MKATTLCEFISPSGYISNASYATQIFAPFVSLKTIRQEPHFQHSKGKRRPNKRATS